jgi:hypothetical protein
MQRNIEKPFQVLAGVVAAMAEAATCSLVNRLLTPSAAGLRVELIIGMLMVVSLYNKNSIHGFTGVSER